MAFLDLRSIVLTSEVLITFKKNYNKIKEVLKYYLVIASVHSFCVDFVYHEVLDLAFDSERQFLDGLGLIEPGKGELFAWWNHTGLDVIRLELPKFDWDFGIIMDVVLGELGLADFDKDGGIILCRNCNSHNALVEIILIRHVPNLE
jgi:hypothetical protein